MLKYAETCILSFVIILVHVISLQLTIRLRFLLCYDRSVLSLTLFNCFSVAFCCHCGDYEDERIYTVKRFKTLTFLAEKLNGWRRRNFLASSYEMNPFLSTSYDLKAARSSFLLKRVKRKTAKIHVSVQSMWKCGESESDFLYSVLL